ncbi:hypothetical protein FS837_007530 [Tulasnella sp. UAMH 9824]|nr:hypothetical protein FS837_007530 [Tulasnella sp. UAMH 9824]
MVPYLSGIWLVLGLTTFPITINANCPSGALCQLNARAGAYQRFWGTCVQPNVTSAYAVPRYRALAINFQEFGMVTPTKGFEMIISIIQDHVTTVAGYYQGRVYAWDVVSEIFDDKGGWRNNIFYKYLGPDFVEIALSAARGADPNAKLYIEEYGAEDVNAKSDSLYDLAKDLKNKGVPLDGIGFEGHLNSPNIPAPSSVYYNTQRFEALDLDWGYTQLGVRIVNGATSPPRQAEDCLAVLEAACLVSTRCVGVSTSGITDLTTIEGMGIWGGPVWQETFFDLNYVPIIQYEVMADYLSLVTVNGNYI